MIQIAAGGHGGAGRAESGPACTQQTKSESDCSGAKLTGEYGTVRRHGKKHAACPASTLSGGSAAAAGPAQRDDAGWQAAGGGGVVRLVRSLGLAEYGRVAVRVTSI